MRDDAVLGRALPLDRGLGPIRTIILIISFFNSNKKSYFHSKTKKIKYFVYNTCVNIGMQQQLSRTPLSGITHVSWHQNFQKH